MKIMKSTLPLAFLAIAACSKSPVNDSQTSDTLSQQSLDVAQNAVASDSMIATAEPSPPPMLRANVAPGVAFDYRYSFSLPADRISSAQEGHAAQCERLGIVHCRVTGMEYSKTADGGIKASLAFKLDPALAGSFARDATSLVERAQGTLAESQINGEDVGSQIVAGDRTTTLLEAELAKVDAQLKIPNLSKSVRSSLVQQGGQLRSQLRALAGDRDSKVESLAVTPVQFSYQANEAIFGFDNQSPVQQALRTSSSSFQSMLSFVIIAIGALAPWALLGGAVFWLVRRWWPKRASVASPE